MKGQKPIRFHKPDIPNIDVSDILKSGEVTNGKYVRELEKLLCKIHKAKYTVCFSSATASLMLALDQCQSKLIETQSFTWKSPKLLLKLMGFRPMWEDIDNETWTVPIENQSGYFPTLLTATLGRIPEIGHPEQTIVDGAANAGYFDMKKHPCNMLIVGFSPAKMVTGIEGGAVLTNHKDIHDDLKCVQPTMFRMGEINAKIAIYNLKRLKKLRNQKLAFYRYYKKHLPFAKFQKIDENHSCCEIAARFPFNEKQWEEVGRHMEIRKRYDPQGIGKNAIEIYREVMSLPSYAGCDCQGVVKLLRKVYYG